MDLSPEYKAELLALARSARAQLEAELELGMTGLPLSSTISAPSAIASASARPPQQERGMQTRADAQARPPAVTPPATPSAPSPASLEANPFAALSRQPVPEGASRVLGPEERRARLQVLAAEAASCTGCVLHEKRSKSVFSRGTPDAELVFVGEGPGRDEDLQGYPFVGAAGQLLDKMITAMGYGREEVYICNVVKCRPPENRTPRPEEALACSRFLVPQLHAVSPKIIVALGRCAAQALGVAEATGSWRGRWGSFQGVVVMPTYHPAFLLRSPEQKRTVWEDLQLVMGRLGKAAPQRK